MALSRTLEIARATVTSPKPSPCAPNASSRIAAYFPSTIARIPACKLARLAARIPSSSHANLQSRTPSSLHASLHVCTPAYTFARPASRYLKHVVLKLITNRGYFKFILTERITYQIIPRYEINYAYHFDYK